MASTLLQIDSLTKSFGDHRLFENISFGIFEGDKIGLIAKNGAGKTTLLNMIAGKEPIDGGKIVFRNEIRFAYLEQSPPYDPDKTVIESCFNTDNDIARVISRYEEVMSSGKHEEMDEVISQMDLLKAWDYELRIKQILSTLKITKLDQKMGELSGGQIKRVALANVLISEPDLVILDEPTNHLDLDMVEWLEDYLSRSGISLLMVTHDRYFLDRVCTQIIEIDDFQIYSYKGNYSYYLEKREERIMNQNAETDRARNLFRKELDWMRRQPQARATKAKARIDDFYKLEEKAKKRKRDAQLRLDGKGSYIGNKIFEAQHVDKRFDEIVITKDFNCLIVKFFFCDFVHSIK